MAEDEAEGRYKAFISYSQKDAAEARKVQTWLENFRLPKALAASGKGRRRLGRIFRDKTDLTASPEVWPELQTKIAESEYLIVLCSPNAAQSRWVDKEIRHFRTTGRADKVLALIIAGTPNSGEGATECFPPAFRETEPLAANLILDGRTSALTRVAAGLANVPFDALWQRERRRQRRRIILISTALVLVTGLAAVATGLGLLAQKNAHEAVVQRDAAIKALAQAVTARAWEIANQGDLELALRYALAGMELAPKTTAEHQAILARILQADPDSRYLTTLEGFPLLGEPSEDPIRLASSSDGTLIAAADPIGKISLIDAQTGETKLQFSPDLIEYFNFNAIGFADNDRKLLIAIEDYGPKTGMTAQRRIEVRTVDDGRLLDTIDADYFVITPLSKRVLLFHRRENFSNEKSGAEIREFDTTTGTLTTLMANGGLTWSANRMERLIVSTDGRWAVSVEDQSGKIMFQLQRLPLEQGAEVGPITEIVIDEDLPPDVYDADFSPDGTQIAIATFDDRFFEGSLSNGTIVIFDFDTETGEMTIARRIAIPGVARSVRFSSDDTIIACWAGGESNAGAILDIESGVRLAELAGFNGVPYCDGVNHDARLLAMSDERGQIRTTRFVEGRLLAFGPGPQPPKPVPQPRDEEFPISIDDYYGGPTAEYYWKRVNANFSAAPAGLSNALPVLFRTSPQGVEWIDFRDMNGGLIPETSKIATGQLDPSGQRFAGLTIDGQLLVYDLASGKKLWEVELDGKKRARAFSFNESGSVLIVEPIVTIEQLSASITDEGKTFDAATGALLEKHSLAGDLYITNLGSDGLDYAYPTDNGRLGWWTHTVPDKDVEIEQQSASVAKVAVSSDRKILATALDPNLSSDDAKEARVYLDSLANFGLVRLFSLADGRESGLMRTGLQDPKFLEFLHESQSLSIGHESQLGVWETTGGRLLWSVKLHPETHVRPDIGAAGDIVLTGGLTQETKDDLYIWDLRRLRDPVDQLRKIACETWLGPDRHVFSAAEIAGDPLLRDVWQAGDKNPRSFCSDYQHTPD